jgi:hypothetical protein
MSLENRQRIRKLELIIYWGSATRNCTLLDPKLWKPLLENLKMLEIIAEGPSDIKENSKLVESWRRWVGPIFEYINEELAPEVGVRIDDDGRHVTKALVEKYIKGHKVWRVKTFKGDIFFMRGQ